jgi:hypothetical protein
MKRFIVFVVVFVLALGLFGGLVQPISVSAQNNCNILADTTSFPAPGRYSVSYTHLTLPTKA